MCLYAAAQSVAPAPGTTLYDLLQLEPNTIRTLPKLPRVGAWGLTIGLPHTGDDSFGVQITDKTQVIVYPTTTLLTPKAGTIEFSVKMTAAYTAAAPQTRVLLDTIPVAGAARQQLILQGTKLTLAWTDCRQSDEDARRDGQLGGALHSQAHAGVGRRRRDAAWSTAFHKAKSTRRNRPHANRSVSCWATAATWLTPPTWRWAACA